MPILTNTFDEARNEMRELAEAFIGGPVKIIVSAEMGGSEEEDELCNKLAALSSGNNGNADFGHVHFDDVVEGEGYLNYVCFEVDGMKFVQELGDNGVVIGDEEEGKTFYVAA